MQLKMINWIFLTCLATALTSESEPRPRRQLYDMKQMIAHKLFTRNEPNCTRSQPPRTRFFRIPGFNAVVVKAVPKESVIPATIIEKIPPNSHLGVVGSYLGTDSIDETYNALLGVNNLYKTGILESKGIRHRALRKPRPFRPTARNLVSACLNTKPVYPPAAEAIGVVVEPHVSSAFPTRYSYKQINQDGSVTTWSSYLDFNQGVKVTEGGKTFPFVIDRIRKIPVRFPVPVLPEVSKIFNPYDANLGHYYPVKVNQPDSSYSYPLFIGNIPISSLHPKVPVVDMGAKPLAVDVPAGHVVYDAPIFERLPPGDYHSYSQNHGISGMVTSHKAESFSAPPKSVIPRIPETHSLKPPVSEFTPYSYNHDHYGVRVENYVGTHGSDVKEHVKDFSASEPLIFGVKPLNRNSFSYKQTSSDGKVISFNDVEINNQPADANGKGNITVGSKVNGIYDSSPLFNRFAYPVPNRFVQIPSVESSIPQKPIRPPSASGTSSFLYKYVHRDGSVTSYGEDSSSDQTPKPEMPTVQGNTRVFDSDTPTYTDPFPIDVNTNAFKPSSPVSGSFSYKLLNNGLVDYHYDIGRNEASVTPKLESIDPFPVSSSPAPMTDYVESDSQYAPIPTFGQSSSFNQEAIPNIYSYTRNGYPQPNPFLALNVDNPETSNQQDYYSNLLQNYNGDLYSNSEEYVYVPPARYDEIPSPIKTMNFPRIPPKKFSNRFLYENFDAYNLRDENFYLPSSTPKPQEILAHQFYDKESLEQVKYNRKSSLSDHNSITNNLVVPELASTTKPDNNVYVNQAPVQVPFNFQPSLSNRNNYPAASEQVSNENYPLNRVDDSKITSTTQSSLNQNLLNSNPETVQQKTSFLFKQSNADGSSITTTNDGNTLSVQVEEARKPIIDQDEQSLTNVEETPRPVDETPTIIPVPVVVEDATRPESLPSTAMPRRRIIKRVKVKQRGDIPEYD